LGLLGGKERSGFTRMAVFAAGATVGAAETVAGASLGTLESSGVPLGSASTSTHASASPVLRATPVALQLDGLRRGRERLASVVGGRAGHDVTALAPVGDADRRAALGKPGAVDGVAD
jgi:hypothetical protein